MNYPEGAGSKQADRVDFDPCVRLELRGTQLSLDGGLLVMSELDDALGRSRLVSAAPRDMPATAINTGSGGVKITGPCRFTLAQDQKVDRKIAEF